MKGSTYYNGDEVESVEDGFLQAVRDMEEVWDHKLDCGIGRWSSVRFYTIHPDSEAQLRESVSSWLRYLDNAGVDYSAVEPNKLGYYFWLARNHQYTFRDIRECPEDVQDQLNNSLKEGGFGEITLGLWTDDYVHVEW